MALDYSGAGCRGTGAVPAAQKRSGSLTREAEFLAGGVIVLAGAFLYPYLERLHAAMPGCLFHRITGLPCLLCGMTRSLAATARGDVAEAFRLHLLGPPLFLLVVVVTALLAAELFLSRRILPRPGRDAWRYGAWGMLALLALAWAARLMFLGINI